MVLARRLIRELQPPVFARLPGNTFIGVESHGKPFSLRERKLFRVGNGSALGTQGAGAVGNSHALTGVLGCQSPTSGVPGVEFRSRLGRGMGGNGWDCSISLTR